MPGWNGEQVYERLRATNPALSERMIFITGDVIGEKTQNFLRTCNKICLSKPFHSSWRNSVSPSAGRSGRLESKMVSIGLAHRLIF